jgi:hypothetical protein
LLLVTCYLLLATCYLLLVTCYLLAPCNFARNRIVALAKSGKAAMKPGRTWRIEKKPCRNLGPKKKKFFVRIIKTQNEDLRKKAKTWTLSRPRSP